MNIITKFAVKWLTWQLLKDPNLWRAYQASISMTMYDRLTANLPLTKKKLHKLCNDGANDFLQLWTRK
jgi:hypothetical protein